MPYSYVPSQDLIRIVNELVGIEYKKSIKNYYSTLHNLIINSPYVAKGLKEKNFARITRSFRKAQEESKDTVSVSNDFIKVLYALVLEKTPSVNADIEHLWKEINSGFREDDQLDGEHFNNSTWEMYFLDNDNTLDGEFMLFKGKLEIGIKEVKLSYKRKKKSAELSLFGTKTFLTKAGNILKIKLWTEKKHKLKREPYVILQFVVDRHKRHKIVEGLFLLYEGDNVLYSGSVLMHYSEKETIELCYLNLHDIHVLNSCLPYQ